ncbi:MAG: DUF1566 domain-containing protein [Deltaproteobacteria bacterium]|nr:DUF1566 domain-containing protein [Deltaproteobacteria bacterium]
MLDRLKNLISLNNIVLWVTLNVFLLTLSCKPAQEPIVDKPLKDSYYGKSYSSKLVGRLGDDLLQKGFAATEMKAIKDGAKLSVINDGLLDSTDLSLVAPSVLKGAQRSLSGLSVTDKTGAIETIIESLFNSIPTLKDASVKAAINYRITNLDKTLTRGEKSSLIPNLTKAAVQNLGGAGVSSGEVPGSILRIVMLISGSLTKLGVAMDEIPDLVKNITSSAVSSMADSGIGTGSYKAAVTSILTGVTIGLNDASYQTDTITIVSYEMVAGVIIGLNKLGIAITEMESYSASITSGMTDGLAGIGVTSTQITHVTEITNSALTDANSILSGDSSPGFEVSMASGNTSEAGTTATFMVRIKNLKPTSDVVVDLASSDESEVVLSHPQLTFTADNWSLRQTVTLSGVDDFIDDGDQIVSIVLAKAISSDANYDGLDPDDVSLTNIDDETASVVVGPISGDVSEQGSSATFTVQLSSEPLDDVSIALQSGDLSEVSIDKQTLIFTPINWNTAQTVTVTGLPDYTVDGDQTVTIVLGMAVSNDAVYNGLDPSDVSVVNVADDTGPLVVSFNPNDGATFVNKITSVEVTFDEPVDPASMTTNEADASCSGSFQLSDDNFTTCVQMTKAPIASNSNKTFTINPQVNLSDATTYKIKITTAVSDEMGNGGLSDQITPTGFTVYVNVFFDSTTNLIWQNNLHTLYDWQGGINYCAGLVLSGFSDWRMPTKVELEALYSRRSSLSYYYSSEYWSSTVGTTSSWAWYVDFSNGSAWMGLKTSNYVTRCVR